MLGEGTVKRIAILGGLVGLLASMVTAAGGPAPGEPAPAIEGETLRHSPFSLEAERGKVVLLQFWASWCVSCMDGLPDLEALRAAHIEEGFEIVGISLDEDLRDARRAIAEHRIEWPQICDGLGVDSPLVQSYGVTATPRYFLVDREGRLASETVPPQELSARVAELLAKSLTNAVSGSLK